MHIIKPDEEFQLHNNNIEVLENGVRIGFIEPNIHNLLCLFSGYFTDDQIIEILQESFQMSYSDSKVVFKKILNRYKYIIMETDNLVRELIPIETKPEKINFGKLKFLVPEILAISLTHDCFMSCRYCYAGALHTTVARPENTLDISLIEKVVKEAKEIGIKQISLTGGDPFCRKDIFDVLDIFEQYGIVIDFSTKKFLTPEDILKLRNYTIISEIQISLDTLDNEDQEYLIGASRYPTEMIKVLESLVREEIKVKVNSVVTSFTIEDLSALILKLDSIGVPNIVISPYTNNLWRHDDSLFPSYKQYEQLVKTLGKLDVTINMNLPTFLKKIEEKPVYGNMEGKTCSAGEDGFVIGPRGTVSICERLLYHEEYSVGNIRDNTLLEIWNSEKLKKYQYPTPELYKGSECYSCNSLEYCLEVRGICYVHSLILNGKLFSPDYNCKHCDNKTRIF